MVNKCCAPNCRGNYMKKDKVSVFKFPSDPNLFTKWVAAVKREKTFIPSKYSRVCERHFDPADIIRETVYFDERTGRRLTAPLAHPRLRENAIPKILPNYPTYLSTTTNQFRKSAKDRQTRLEMQQEIVFKNPTCSEPKHEEILLKYIVRSATNTRLKNYVKIQNEKACLGTVSKKRKPETVE